MLDAQDHRAIARRMDLFHFEDEAPGMVFWHPRGLAIYRALEEAQRERVRAEGYEEVRSPQLLRRPIWEASGHWEYFREGMMRIADEENIECALKPVSCPGHVKIVERMAPSYRDLPIRLAELGIVHRNELRGALHGLMRLRQFSQDDGHVFCREEQALEEVVRFVQGARRFYAQLGFDDLDIALSLRPAHRAGDEASWERAERILSDALSECGEAHRIEQGGGAFYGPKIEIALRDRAGRSWQCGTIQVDLVMPKRFDLRYVDAAGQKQSLVMLHRALYGSLERMLGVLLEHHGVALPVWLAPVQAVVIPIGENERDLAQSIHDVFRGDGLRVALDARDLSLARRIAAAHEIGVPFIAVVGKREAEKREVALRSRDGQELLPLDMAREKLREAARMPA